MAQLRNRYSLPGEVSVEDEQCIVCGAGTTFCCSRCRRVFYCSQSCQRLDWRSHKLTCSEVSVTPPPPVALGSGQGLPSPTITLESQVSMHERATETLKQSLMARFGSMLGAYEWFDVHRGGIMDFDEFERTLETNGVTKASMVKSMFKALDREDSGQISLSKFFSDAVKKLNPRDLGDPIGSPQAASISTPPVELHPSDPESLPAGRRALRAAAILAFRNGRYDDAIVSSLQALGITSPGARWVSYVPRHPDSLTELLLLAKVFATTKQFSKGQPFIKLIGDIFPPTCTVFPSHVLATLLCCTAELMDQYDHPSTGAYYDAYLDLTLKVFGGSSLVYGDALTVVSAFNFRRGALDAALTYCDRAKKIRKENLVSPHARLADAFNNRGIILKALQRFKEAVAELKEAASQRVKLFGVTSLPVADVFFTLGTCGEEPDKYFTACHSVRLRLLGPSHSDTLAVAEELKRLGITRAPERTVEIALPVSEKENSKPVTPPRARVSLGSPPSTSDNPKLKPLIIKSSSEPRKVRGNEQMVLPVIKGKSPPKKEEIPAAKESSESESENESHSAEPSDEGGIPQTNMSMLLHSPKVSIRMPENPATFPRSPSMKLPDSPFARSQTEMGGPEFVESLLTLDENVMDDSGFVIQKALPKKPPAFWIPIAMKTVYAKKIIKEESEEDSPGARIEAFFKGLLHAEQDVRLVFKLLNGIFTNIHGQKAAGLFAKTPKRGLNVGNFIEFLHSRTQNVEMMQYFSELLKERHIEAFEQILDDLVGITDLEDVLVAKYVEKIDNVKKSMTFIQTELAKIPAGAAGPSEEGRVVGEAIALLPEIKRITTVIVDRQKIISRGVTLLGELFACTKPLEDLELAMAGIAELYYALEDSDDSQANGGISNRLNDPPDEEEDEESYEDDDDDDEDSLDDDEDEDYDEDGGDSKEQASSAKDR